MEKLCKEIPINPIPIKDNVVYNHIRVEVCEGYWHRIYCVIYPIDLRPSGNCLIIGDNTIAHEGMSEILFRTRKSRPEKVKEYADIIFPHAEQIANLFLGKKYKEIRKLLKNLSNKKIAV